MPNQKKRNNLNVLKLKIAKEDADIANFELDAGSIDLAEILSEIRQRIPDSQKNKYDMFFFGRQKEISEPRIASNQFEVMKPKETHNTLKSEVKKTKSSSPEWLKKLYRQIVKRSHPDKYIDFPIKEIKEKFTRVYMDATKALNETNAGLMLLCAYEVEVSIEGLNAKNHIDSAIQRYASEIKSIKALMGYQWYHIHEDRRIGFIESYLASMGYLIDKKATEDIVASRPSLARKRKAGTRPEKFARFKK